MDILNDIEKGDLYIDAATESSLKETAGWGRFIGIAGMAISGFAAVLSFTLGGRVESAMNEGLIRSRMGTQGYLWALVILLAALAIFVVSYFMFRFSNKLQSAVNAADQYDFIDSMKQLRNTYRIMAILFTVYVLLSVGNSITRFF